MRPLNPEPTIIQRYIVQFRYQETSRCKSLQNMTDEEVRELEERYGPLGPQAKARRLLRPIT